MLVFKNFIRYNSELLTSDFLSFAAESGFGNFAEDGIVLAGSAGH
jgi:hypothetical protein